MPRADQGAGGGVAGALRRAAVTTRTVSNANPIVLIAAVARNAVIGRDGGMPWHLRPDLKRLRELTTGHAVVMGRRTWESLPARFRPLPQRRNIVVSRNAAFVAPGAEVAGSLQQALALARSAAAPGEPVFVIGGAQLYEQALPVADVLELTELHVEVPGDTLFPPWDRAAFTEAQRVAHAADAGGAPAFDFVTYRRRSPNT